MFGLSQAVCPWSCVHSHVSMVMCPSLCVLLCTGKWAAESVRPGDKESRSLRQSNRLLPPQGSKIGECLAAIFPVHHNTLFLRYCRGTAALSEIVKIMNCFC